jgi:hypothetical protein
MFDRFDWSYHRDLDKTCAHLLRLVKIFEFPGIVLWLPGVEFSWQRKLRQLLILCCDRSQNQLTNTQCIDNSLFSGCIIMTLIITQATNPQSLPILIVDKEPKRSRPICRWYTAANGKLCCRWIEQA